MIAIGNFLFRYRNAIFPSAFALVFLPGPRLFADPQVGLALGAGIAFVGQAIRAVTIGLRYIIRGGRERRVYAEDLVTEGLYGHSRNPMYAGNLLILSGIAVASNSLACVLAAIPLFAFFYACIVAAEEAFLRRKFGAAFDAYVHEVPRWRIRLRGFRETLVCTRFSWQRVLVKEYGTVAAWLAGLAALGLVRGMNASLRPVLIAILALTGVAWCLARWLKKARVVVAD